MPFFAFVIGLMIGFNFGQGCVENTYVLHPETINECVELCKNNQGMTYIKLNGDCACVNGAKFKIKQKD